MYRISIVATLLLLMLIPARATEFGNAFGDASRSASIDALTGLQQFLEALKNRELGKGTGIDNLIDAYNSLSAAAKKMESMKPDVSQEKGIIYEKLDVSDREFIIYMAKLVDRRPPKTNVELYGLFASSTARMAEIMKSAAKSGDRPIYPQIAREFANYVAFAGLVTRLVTPEAGR